MRLGGLNRLIGALAFRARTSGYPQLLKWQNALRSRPIHFSSNGLRQANLRPARRYEVSLAESPADRLARNGHAEEVNALALIIWKAWLVDELSATRLTDEQIGTIIRKALLLARHSTI